MEYVKIYLENKILKSLFFDKDGRGVLPSVQSHFEARNLTHHKLLEEFHNLNDLRDEVYWSKIVEIVNACFNKALRITDYNLAKDDEFKKLVNDIVAAKFDFVFEADESKKIVSREHLDSFLSTIKNKDTISIPNADGVQRLIIPQDSTYSTNAEPNEPKTLHKYPNLLIRIEKDRISFNCSKKTKVTSFINRVETVKDAATAKVLADFDEGEFESLKIDVKNIFTNLKEEGFFIKNIRFQGPQFYFMVGSQGVIDYTRLIDEDFYLNTILDFIHVKQIKCVYSTNIDDKEKDFKVTIKVNVRDHADAVGTVKFSITIAKNKNLTTAIENEIADRLKRLGIIPDCSYQLPAEYYLNKLIHKDGDIGRIVNRIRRTDKANAILKEFIEKKILDEKTASIDSSKLMEYIVEELRKLQGKVHTANEREFRIDKIDLDESSRPMLSVKISDEAVQDNQYYQVILAEDVRGYDRVLKVILSCFDFSFVLNKLSQGKDADALEYIYRRVSTYLLYEYEVQLEKEAKSAHQWLAAYASGFSAMEKDKKPNELGVTVEKKLNMLLKYTHRNFKPVGGPKKPDGYLFREKDDTYLLDSKQHKDIYIGEIDKMARYLFTYCKDEALPKANTGVLVICKGKLSRTLNKKAVDEWKKSDEFKQKFRIGFVSLEFILNIYELLKKQRVQAHPLIKKQVMDSLYDAIDKSVDFETVAELDKSEKKILDGLSKAIQRENYIPQEAKEL